MTYGAIAAELERAGHVNERGKPFHHKSVRATLELLRGQSGSRTQPGRAIEQVSA